MPVAEGPEAFFGYIGVACALVFASIFLNLKISEQLMEQQNQAWA